MGPAAQTSIPKLVEALETPECESAHAIIYALGRFGPAATPVKESLLKRLSEPGLAVISAWALAQIDGASPEVTSKILPALATGLKDPSAETRQLAVEALGKVKSLSPNAIAAIERATQDSNQGVREAATEALRSARGSGTK
jgi:HEAT repeat protein